MTQTFSRPSPFDIEGTSAAHQPLVTDADLLTDHEPADTLARMGEALLDVVRQAALAKGVTLPSRQSYYMAPIPADCEQVAVLFTGWVPQPTPEGGTLVCRTFRWQAGYSVIITRCTPAIPQKRGKTGPELVAPELMMAAARIASADAEVLLECVNRLGEVGSDLSIVTNAPSGGMQTTELNVPLLSTGSF